MRNEPTVTHQHLFLLSLQGFVSENPTAPVQVIKRRAPPCLNDFCRLGCVCSSLRKERRITHCGKQDCIFGCSCLRQKVVLLKNLDGPDSSASEEGLSKKKRKRRMRMAYSECPFLKRTTEYNLVMRLYMNSFLKDLYADRS